MLPPHCLSATAPARHAKIRHSQPISSSKNIACPSSFGLGQIRLEHTGQSGRFIGMEHSLLALNP